MICWLRRTGATTWRSFPPLQMIIAIIIVMFYSIFFCCSIWTLIRVCVGHTPRHPSSIILLPHTVKRFNPTPISAHSRPAFKHPPAPSALWTAQNLGKQDWGKEGVKKSLYQLGTSTFQLSPFHSSSSSVYHALDFSLKFFIAVELWLRPFLTHPPPTFWYRWVVLLSIFLLWLHTTFPVRQELIRTFKGRLNLLWGLRTLRPSKTFRRLTKKAGFAEQNTFLDV